MKGGGAMMDFVEIYYRDGSNAEACFATHGKVTWSEYGLCVVDYVDEEKQPRRRCFPIQNLVYVKEKTQKGG